MSRKTFATQRLSVGAENRVVALVSGGTATTPPSSAGTCSTCGKHAEKRYGGEGKYPPECAECWTREWAKEMAVSRAIEEAWNAEAN